MSSDQVVETKSLQKVLADLWKVIKDRWCKDKVTKRVRFSDYIFPSVFPFLPSLTPLTPVKSRPCPVNVQSINAVKLLVYNAKTNKPNAVAAPLGYPSRSRTSRNHPFIVWARKQVNSRME